jgi:hypothetical protein
MRAVPVPDGFKVFQKALNLLRSFGQKWVQPFLEKTYYEGGNRLVTDSKKF